MAIDVKEIIADGLLQLCEETPLEIITIKQLLEVTSVRWLAVYKHFLDENDFIQ